jgi:hypothetical protein
MASADVQGPTVVSSDLAPSQGDKLFAGETCTVVTQERPGHLGSTGGELNGGDRVAEHAQCGSAVRTHGNTMLGSAALRRANGDNAYWSAVGQDGLPDVDLPIGCE